MRKATAVAATTKSPAAKKKSSKPATPATLIDDIRDARGRRALQSACDEVREYQNQIAALEALKRDLVARVIGPTVERLKLQKVAGEGWLLLRRPPSKRLSKMKLLEFGVPMRTIEKATVASGSVSYQVRGREDGDSDNGEEESGVEE